MQQTRENSSSLLGKLKQVTFLRQSITLFTVRKARALHRPSAAGAHMVEIEALLAEKNRAPVI
jgi:hypothetical protein